MPLPPGTRLGSCIVGDLVGAGGMGEVYRGRDTRLDRDVALKVLPARLADDHDRLVRLEREAKTLASLNHPHIAAIYGIEEFETANGASELWASDVNGHGPTFEAGPPRRLAALPPHIVSLEATPDRTRFLALVRENPTAARSITLLTNWTAALDVRAR